MTYATTTFKHYYDVDAHTMHNNKKAIAVCVRCHRMFTLHPRKLRIHKERKCRPRGSGKKWSAAQDLSTLSTLQVILREPTRINSAARQ